MSKRFTDTDKWKRPWFRNLPPAMRELWGYMLDNCDHAGVWVEDIQGAALLMGLPIVRAEYEAHLGPKLVRVAPDKVFIPSFIEFQYGELREGCKPHAAVLKALKRVGINPLSLDLLEGYPKGIHTLKDKDKDQDKEKEKEKGGVGENKTAVSASLASEQVRACRTTWLETLAHFKQPRAFLLPPEELAIARAIQENGAEATDLALYGARHEPAHEGWDPRAHVDINRVLGRTKDGKARIQKFVGFGVAARAKSSGAAVPPPEEPEKLRAFIRSRAVLGCSFCGSPTMADCTCGMAAEGA